MDEDDGGMIIVSGKNEKNEDILITIEDNGMGMRGRKVLENNSDG